jgi:hypothetical protein
MHGLLGNDQRVAEGSPSIMLVRLISVGNMSNVDSA